MRTSPYPVNSFRLPSSIGSARFFCPTRYGSPLWVERDLGAAITDYFLLVVVVTKTPEINSLALKSLPSRKVVLLSGKESARQPSPPASTAAFISLRWRL